MFVTVEGLTSVLNENSGIVPASIKKYFKVVELLFKYQDTTSAAAVQRGTQPSTSTELATPSSNRLPRPPG